jgi:non-ribosomal peptide synthetase component F
MNLAEGYVNRPDLNSERFIPNPLAKSEDKEKRLYKTGDLARISADGDLEIRFVSDQCLIL